MKKNLFIYLGIVLMMVSCYPDGAEYYEDMDLVYTSYEKDFDFKAQKTYSMPDKIVKITGSLVGNELPEYVSEPFNSQILKRIEDNMTACGWTKTADPNNADMVLFPACWTNTTVYYWYDYWCWYYYYCGYGWTYPSVASYTSGTFVMTFIPAKGDYIEPLITWNAAANGLLSGSYSTTRINNAIDQAFEQSPYLKIK